MRLVNCVLSNSSRLITLSKTRVCPVTSYCFNFFKTTGTLLTFDLPYILVVVLLALNSQIISVPSLAGPCAMANKSALNISWVKSLKR